MSCTDVTCSVCKSVIAPGDDYFADFDTTVCEECIDSYILARHDFCDIAEELGMSRKRVPDELETEKPESPIKGQLDMFGGVVGENA